MNAEKIMLYQSRKANPTTVWLLFIFLGWSYGSLGKIEMQVFFYMTFGGLGIWAIIRLFTLSQAIKAYNREIADKAGLSMEEMVLLGVFN